MFADELAGFIARGKLQELQRICEDASEAVPTFALEVIDFSREAAETQHDIAELLHRTNNLEMELYESRASERLACDKIQKAEARLKALEKHVEASESNHL